MHIYGWEDVQEMTEVNERRVTAGLETSKRNSGVEGEDGMCGSFAGGVGGSRGLARMTDD